MLHRQWGVFFPVVAGALAATLAWRETRRTAALLGVGAVAQVVESCDESFPVGSYVSGLFGWQEYALAGRGRATPISPDVPLTWHLGVLGVTGVTAYFGLLDVGKPKRGETVVVSGAAGATGSVAAQIARIVGARAIGIAGGSEKCAWLRNEARLEFERALQLDPAAAYALNNLCYTWTLDGQVRAAVAACQRAIAIQPDLQLARNNLGLAYAVGGSLDASEQAFASGGEQARAHYNMGIVYLARRQHAEALKAFEAAQRERPEFGAAAAMARQAWQLANRSN